MVSAIQAWTILKAQALGEPGAVKAAEMLTQDGQEQLHRHFIRFTNKATEFLAEVDAEGEALTKNVSLDVHNWTITDAYQYLAAIKGSKYEQFHLTALLRVPNVDLIWDEMKPEVAAA